MRRHELENQLRNANTVSEEKQWRRCVHAEWLDSSSFLFNVKKANKKSFKRFPFSRPTSKPCKRRMLSCNDNWAISIWRNVKLNGRSYVWKKTRMSWRKLSIKSVVLRSATMFKSFSSGRTWTSGDRGHHPFLGPSGVRSTIPSTPRREPSSATSSGTIAIGSQRIRASTGPTVRQSDENLWWSSGLLLGWSILPRVTDGKQKQRPNVFDHHKPLPSAL